jgi:hypothetical protein
MASVKAAEAGKLLYGQAFTVWSVPEGASQTFKAGELVMRTSGYLTICGADPALVLGIALEDANNNATDGENDILVLVATANALLKMSVYHSNATYNVVEDTDLGTDYGVVCASNKWLVDKTDNSNKVVRVQQFLDPIGEEAGQVLVSVLAAVREVS